MSSNYYDCPDCNVRTANIIGCGICGRKATEAELAENVRKDAEFDKRLRSMPYSPPPDKETRFGMLVISGPTLLDALTHEAGMNPTPENIERLTKYEAELRALGRKIERAEASQRRKSEKFVEKVLPDSEYEWADEDGHRVRRKRA